MNIENTRNKLKFTVKHPQIQTRLQPKLYLEHCASHLTELLKILFLSTLLHIKFLLNH